MVVERGLAADVNSVRSQMAEIMIMASKKE
jgi:hypothetical protein